MLRLLRRSSLAWPLLGVLALVGCQDEEIRRYKVARTQTAPPRMLGAIIPSGDQMWFVKLMGPTPAVTEQQAAFDQFVRSLRFKDGAKPPITWTLPGDWQDADPDQMSFAAFRAGTNGPRVTVTQLGQPGTPANILDNVNRWRGQVGLGKIATTELGTTTHTIDVDGHTVTLVDLGGAADKGPSPSPHPQVPNLQPEVPAGSKPITYDVPAGWEELPASGFRVAAFRVRDGDRTADVTVIPLGGQAGGLLANVNRWRGEVGLPDITEAQLAKEAKEIGGTGNLKGFTVDLLGPESAGANRKRTLGAIFLHDERSWFVKLMGPADLVGKQQSAFDAFVKSLRFTTNR
jgi:hypothetical protein